MDVLELERLVALVHQSGVSELTLRQSEQRITIRRPAEPHLSTALVPVGDSYETDGGDGEAEFDDDPGEPADETGTITAPLVGYFRHVKPVVGLGAKVRVGQKVGEIEAMNLVNEVTSSLNGTVVDARVSDGIPVEYDQPLFVVQIED